PDPCTGRDMRPGIDRGDQGKSELFNYSADMVSCVVVAKGNERLLYACDSKLCQTLVVRGSYDRNPKHCLDGAIRCQTCARPITPCTAQHLDANLGMAGRTEDHDVSHGVTAAGLRAPAHRGMPRTQYLWKTLAPAGSAVAKVPLCSLLRLS